MPGAVLRERHPIFVHIFSLSAMTCWESAVQSRRANTKGLRCGADPKWIIRLDPMVQWSNTKPGRWELLHIMGTECFMCVEGSCQSVTSIIIHLHTESKTHCFLRISSQNSHQSAIHSWLMCIFIKRQKHPRGKWLDTNPAAPSHAFSTGHSSAISGSLVSMKVSRSWCLEHLPEGVCTFLCQKKWQIQEMFVHACTSCTTDVCVKIS